MNLQDIHIAWTTGRIDKEAYVEHMYVEHKRLFEYADFLKGSDVESIRIESGSIRVGFKWPPIELLVPREEMRAAPVEALNFGAYEKREFAIAESIVASLPAADPVLIDIGGNVGFYSIGLKKLHPALRIHAFEPVPATADQFEANCQLNGYHDISLHRFGLSDQPGQATFYVPPLMSVAASRQNILEGDEIMEVMCPLVALDDMMDDLPGPVDFIKCDVEGAELFAFRGAAKLIERDQPVVFSEMLRKWSAKFNYHPNDIITFFKERGYRCFPLGESDEPAIDEVTEQTIETNFIFLNQEKHESIRLHS